MAPKPDRNRCPWGFLGEARKAAGAEPTTYDQAWLRLTEARIAGARHSSEAPALFEAAASLQAKMGMRWQHAKTLTESVLNDQVAQGRLFQHPPATKRTGPRYGAARPEPFDPARCYGNWWWGFSRSAVMAMVEASGFAVAERHWTRHHLTLVAEKIVNADRI